MNQDLSWGSENQTPCWVTLLYIIYHILIHWWQKQFWHYTMQRSMSTWLCAHHACVQAIKWRPGSYLFFLDSLNKIHTLFWKMFLLFMLIMWFKWGLVCSFIGHSSSPTDWPRGRHLNPSWANHIRQHGLQAKKRHLVQDEWVRTLP